eukprot:Seg7804.1 transcript_id=Seg7804.1/GoldUCD/mRNA.D3Y31 product="Beta-1 adrenergic receptor" protein_id=Seg7804.1/GoldUCD/D3Y31
MQLGNNSDNMAPKCQQFSENIKQNAEIVACLAVLPSFLAISGNAIFFITFIKTRSLQTPSNLLLSAVCVADLMVGLIYDPIFVAFLFGVRYGYRASALTLSYFLLFELFAGVSGALSFSITLDRYMAICHPFWYHSHVTCKRYLALALSIAFLFVILVTIARTLMALNSHSGVIATAVITAYLAVVTSLVVLMYIRIYKAASRQTNRVVNIGTIEGEEQNRKIQQRKREHKTTYTVGLVLGIWILFSLPSLVEGIAILGLTTNAPNSAFCYIDILKFDMWAKLFTVVSSFANPLVYCYRSKDIRKAAFKIFWPKQIQNTPTEV